MTWRSDPEIRRNYSRDYMREWRKQNPDKLRVYNEARNLRDRGATNRRYNLKACFGITPDEFNSILAAQGGRCKVCEVELQVPHKHTHVDHDHATKRVRGILCHHCNVGLGHFKDNSALLRTAAEYLEQRP